MIPAFFFHPVPICVLFFCPLSRFVLFLMSVKAGFKGEVGEGLQQGQVLPQQSHPFKEASVEGQYPVQHVNAFRRRKETQPPLRILHIYTHASKRKHIITHWNNAQIKYRNKVPSYVSNQMLFAVGLGFIIGVNDLVKMQKQVQKNLQL